MAPKGYVFLYPDDSITARKGKGKKLEYNADITSATTAEDLKAGAERYHTVGTGQEPGGHLRHPHQPNPSGGAAQDARPSGNAQERHNQGAVSRSAGRAAAGQQIRPGRRGGPQAREAQMTSFSCS